MNRDSNEVQKSRRGNTWEKTKQIGQQMQRPQGRTVSLSLENSVLRNKWLGNWVEE